MNKDLSNFFYKKTLGCRVDGERQKDNGLSARKYYLCYTFFFVLIALLVFSFFIKNGKSFVYCDTNEGGDGLVQHYNSFVYYGQYLRQIIKTLIFEHKLEIPMFDLSIGYGQDIVSTLSYYVIGDPFSFLSVFIPTRMAEYGYSAIIVLRIFCAGISFSMYCRYRGYRNGYTLIGAYIYAFSYYTLLVAVLHPYFMLPVIYLPLLLIGAEKVLNKESHIPFILTVALAGLSNFYFFYMLCIMIVIYVVFRYLQLFAKIHLKELLLWIGKFLLDAILGICVAAVLLLPSVISIFSSSRLSSDVYVPILYSLKYYLQLLPSFVGSGGDYYAHMGYTALAFISVVVIFMRSRQEKKYRYLCVGFVLLMIFLMIPFFGHFFNGMSYVTNRWIWALAFLAAYITVVALPLLADLKEKEWGIIITISLLTAIAVYSSNAARTEKNLNILAMLFIIVLFVYVLSKTTLKKYMLQVCMVIVMISISVNAMYLYSPSEGNYLQYFTNAGEAYQLLTENAPGAVLEEVEDESIYRFDTAGISAGDVKRNSAMQLGLYSTAYYFSTTSNVVSCFFSDMYMNYSFEQSYNNLDCRTWIDMLMGVKYFVVPLGNERLLPYSYNEYITENDRYMVYSSDNALPFGFTSSNIISQDSFDSMNVEEKQQALLQGIVVDAADSDSVKSNYDEEIEFTEETSYPTIEVSDGVLYEEGKFIVTKTEATVTFTFESVDNSELYVIWEGLDYESMNPYTLYDEETLGSMSLYEQNRLKRQYQYWEDYTAVYFTMTAGTRSTTTTIRTNKNTYYAGYHDFLCNLGYSEIADNSITVTFHTVGTYTYDSVRVVSQPMDNFESYCSKLQNETLEDVVITSNKVTGLISVSDDKVLCIQIPYSKGWSAKVDGQTVELYKVDDVFIGLMIQEGNHEIELIYMSPYLKVGGLISILGVIGLLAFVVAQRRINNHADRTLRK